MRVMVHAVVHVEKCTCYRRAVISEIAAFQQKHGLCSSPTAVEDIREIRLERARQIVPGKPKSGKTENSGR